LRGGQKGEGGGHDCCDEPWRFILTCLRRLNLSPLPYKTQKVELKQNTRELPAHPHLSFTTQARNCCASPADAALGRQLQTGAARSACTSCRHCSQCEKHVRACDNDREPHKLTTNHATASLKLPFWQWHLVGAHDDDERVGSQTVASAWDRNSGNNDRAMVRGQQSVRLERQKTANFEQRIEPPIHERWRRLQQLLPRAWSAVSMGMHTACKSVRLQLSCRVTDQLCAH
jgi:hypothetical protein